jgi:molybdenum cofactor synthesis domain-containing protein
MHAPTASLIVVGSEVLSAKVPDENGPFLARRLRELGVGLRALVTVADRMDDIVEAVDRERRRVDWLFTSGGVGPTHDDVTVAAVGRALGRPLVRLAALEEVIRALHRRLHGGEPSEAALRMAVVPEGAVLVGDREFPTVQCANVVLLPGVPRFFAWQFERFAPALAGTPFRLACVYLRVPEDRVAAALDAVAHAHPAVEIGSYPRFDEAADHLVRLTVEARDLAAVQAALAALLAALPAEAVLRVEGP